MVAEVCARFHGYPSSYYKTKTFADLRIDHEDAMLLAKAEDDAIRRAGVKNA